MATPKYVGLSIKPYNDLEIANGGLRVVTDAEAVGQHARQRLSCFRGEWFLDGDVGVDWFGQVFGGRPDRVAIGEALAKRCVLTTPGVTAVTEMRTEFGQANRGMQITRCSIETVFDQEVAI